MKKNEIIAKLLESASIRQLALVRTHLESQKREWGGNYTPRAFEIEKIFSQQSGNK